MLRVIYIFFILFNPNICSKNIEKMSEEVFSGQHPESLHSLQSSVIDRQSQNLDNGKQSQLSDMDQEKSCDECCDSANVKVYSSSDVHIGPTFNIYSPLVVSGNYGQNLPLQSSSAQVHLHGCTKPSIGSRINYNGPVTIKQILNVNASECEFEKLAILDQANDNTRTTVRLIGRRMWLAQPPLESLEPLQHPVCYVVILHTATEECLTQSDCIFTTRHIQNFHIEGNGWEDIGYSFLIGGDGNVYEGRGWDAVGAFAKGYNRQSIGIAMIGTFTKVLPSDLQINSLHYWIQEGVRLGKISPHYKILTHHQLSATTSPGTAFVELIKTWPRWSSTPAREGFRMDIPLLEDM